MSLVMAFLEEVAQLPAYQIEDIFRAEAQTANASSKRLAVLVALYAKKLEEEGGLSRVDARRTAVRTLAASSNHALDTMRRYIQIGDAILDRVFDAPAVETLPVRVLGVLLRIRQYGGEDAFKDAVQAAMNGASLEELNLMAKKMRGTETSEKAGFKFELGILYYSEGDRVAAIGGLNVVDAQNDPFIARGIRRALQALGISITEEVSYAA